MFNRRKKKMAKYANALQGFTPTSKYALKHFCLTATGLDLDEAQKLYTFLADGLESLPDLDPLPPSFIDKTKNTLNELFGMVDDHKEQIGQVVGLIQSLSGKKTFPQGAAVEPLPPING